MDRKQLLGLKEKHWVELWDGRDVEVCLVPAGMPDVTTAKLMGINPERLVRSICTDAFIDFKGYVEGDKPVENTLENRIEFFGFPACRDAITMRLQLMNLEVLQGEETAVND